MTIWGTYGIIIANFGITFGYFFSNYSSLLSQLLIFGGLVFELFVYGMTYGPIMWMWAAEALQPSQIGYVSMASWGGAAFILILFPVVQKNIDNQGFIFLFFGVIAVLSLIVTKRLMIETKGKKDFEIAE